MRKILTILPFIFLLACLAPVAGFEPPADPAPTKTTIPPAAPLSTAVRSTTCATVNTDSLHVRYGPNEHAQAMGWVTEDTTLKILDDSGDWWKINGAGIDDQGRQARMTGYVNSDYLTVTECEP
jgi:hypothetical protein